MIGPSLAEPNPNVPSCIVASASGCVNTCDSQFDVSPSAATAGPVGAAGAAHPSCQPRIHGPLLAWPYVWYPLVQCPCRNPPCACADQLGPACWTACARRSCACATDGELRFLHSRPHCSLCRCLCLRCSSFSGDLRPTLFVKTQIGKWLPFYWIPLHFQISMAKRFSLNWIPATLRP